MENGVTVLASGEEARLYEAIAGRILGMIESRTLRVGEKVPSVRTLSQQQGVSISTVLQAYRVLENQGWLEARPQSGYYVKRNSVTLPPEPETTRPRCEAAPVAIKALMHRFFQASMDKHIVQMGAAVGDPCTFPTRNLNRALSKVLKRDIYAANSYDVAPGNVELRTQIARRAMDSGCQLTPEDIVITTGCTEALNLCLRAVAVRGDTILLESPTYHSTLQILESLGLKALEIPTHPRDGISLDALEFALDKQQVAACLLMPCLHNPLGSSMPLDSKKRLLQLLREKKVPLIEDDVWGDTTFASPRPVTVKSMDRDGDVLLCSSFSKTIAPGYRVGWVAPGRYRREVEYLKLVGTLANPTLPSLVIAEFLENGGYDHHVRTIRRMHQEHVTRMVALLEKYFPAGVRVTRPVGGEVVWVEVDPAVDTVELFNLALEEGICIAPGAIFSATNKYKNFLRLYCGHEDDRTTERAIATLARLTAQLAQKGNP